MRCVDAEFAYAAADVGVTAATDRDVEVAEDVGDVR
jgi:hypothetical protein